MGDTRGGDEEGFVFVVGLGILVTLVVGAAGVSLAAGRFDFAWLGVAGAALIGFSRSARLRRERARLSDPERVGHRGILRSRS